MEFKNHPDRHGHHLLSAPFIYSMIIPIALLDLMGEVYHNIAFPLYQIPKIERSKYIKIDRYKLSKLSSFEKLNCAYCGYANGVLPYYTAIAAATEKYWCGIKHQKTNDNFEEPEHHREFEEYEKYQENTKKTSPA